MRAAILTVIVASLVTMACGKYGPPLRAGEQPEREPEPAIGIPLPASPESAPEEEP